MSISILESKLKRHKITYSNENGKIIIGKSKNDYLVLIGSILFPIALAIGISTFSIVNNIEFNAKVSAWILFFFISALLNLWRVKVKKQVNNSIKILENKTLRIEKPSGKYLFDSRNIYAFDYSVKKVNEDTYEGNLYLIDGQNRKFKILGFDDETEKYVLNDLKWFSQYLTHYLDIKESITFNSIYESAALGPTYLEGVTKRIIDPKNSNLQEWKGYLQTSTGNSKFKIKYYGELHENYNNLIAGTDFAPQIVCAIDVETGQEIILFDGCKHGYNALFSDKFTKEQINNRPLNGYYMDKNENEVFDIIISAFYNFDYEEEFKEEVDQNGMIELIDGTMAEFNSVKRNGYDSLEIWGVRDNSKEFCIMSEEFA